MYVQYYIFYLDFFNSSCRLGHCLPCRRRGGGGRFVVFNVKLDNLMEIEFVLYFMFTYHFLFNALVPAWLSDLSNS